MGHTFIANLNADKIYIERGYLADPIIYVFQVSLQNQSSTQAIYFQATTTLSGWTITAPALGKLGAVGAGGTANVVITVSRARPGSDTTDTGNIRIEGFSDSGYTISLGYDDLPCSVYFEDTEAWATKTIYTFAGGTLEGWAGSLFAVNNDKSIEVGGYSAKWYFASAGGPGRNWNASRELSKSIDIPNKTKVRVTFYFCYYGVTGHEMSLYYGYPKIYVDATLVNAMNMILDGVGTEYSSFLKGWYKMTADISAYKNLTKTIKWQCYCQAIWLGGNGIQNTSNFSVWLDRIVIAGTD